MIQSAAKQVYKISNMSDKDATLLEPTACAIHGMDKLSMPVGSEVLLIGSGPTGLMLCQLLKLNGARKVVLAANKGIKMDIAKNLQVADEYVELDRSNPEAQWKQLKENNPYGFDVVVSAVELPEDIGRHILPVADSSLFDRLKPLESKASRTIRSITFAEEENS